MEAPQEPESYEAKSGLPTAPQYPEELLIWRLDRRFVVGNVCTVQCPWPIVTEREAMPHPQMRYVMSLTYPIA